MIHTPAREVAAARRDLTLIVVAIVGLARLLDGPLTWVVAGLLLATTLVGALQVLAHVDGPDAEHGVPVESLILPAVAAIGQTNASGANRDSATTTPTAIARSRTPGSPLTGGIVGARVRRPT